MVLPHSAPTQDLDCGTCHRSAYFYLRVKKVAPGWRMTPDVRKSTVPSVSTNMVTCTCFPFPSGDVRRSKPIFNFSVSDAYVLADICLLVTLVKRQDRRYVSRLRTRYSIPCQRFRSLCAPQVAPTVGKERLLRAPRHASALKTSSV